LCGLVFDLTQLVGWVFCLITAFSAQRSGYTAALIAEHYDSVNHSCHLPSLVSSGRGTCWSDITNKKAVLLQGNRAMQRVSDPMTLQLLG